MCFHIQRVPLLHGGDARGGVQAAPAFPAVGGGAQAHVRAARRARVQHPQAAAARRRGGAVQLLHAVPLSTALESAPGDPSLKTLKCDVLVSSLCFQMQLVSLRGGAPHRRVRGRQGAAVHVASS
jgi:hypothetical protein